MAADSRLDVQAERELRRSTPASAYDEELAAGYMPPALRAIAHAEPPDGGLPEPTLAASLCTLLTPWTLEELEGCKEPYPHVFMGAGERGFFPIGEVTVVGARGREGKTTVLTAISVAAAIGRSLANLSTRPSMTVIYSAEDDRSQYGRKVLAQLSLLPEHQGAAVMSRVIVPNLEAPEFAAARALVTVFDRRPMEGAAVEAIVEALRPLCEAEVPLRTVVFETASTLSDAEEDNQGHKVLIAALKRIARELQVAVVLVHHTSQAADQNLPELSVSVSDIRGGTSLVYNARQTWLLVNLGSDDEPWPDADARTVLRRMLCEEADQPIASRLLALVCLDTSKSAPVPPIYFRWLKAPEGGAAAVEHDAPDVLADRPWRKVHEMVKAERAELRHQARAEKTAAVAGDRERRIVDAVAHLQASCRDEPVTANKIEIQAGMSSKAAKPVITAAVAAGLIVQGTTLLRGKPTRTFSLPLSGPTTGGTGVGNASR